MIPLQSCSPCIFVAPQAYSAAGTAVGNIIDMLGFSQLDVYVSAASTTTGAVPASITIQHSDDTNTSNFSTIISAGTATTGWPTSLTATTSQSSAFAVASIPWLTKKRYVRVNPLGGTSAATICVMGIRSRDKIADSGTAAGAAFTFTVT